MMKRIISVILAMLIFILSCVTVFAQSYDIIPTEAEPQLILTSETVITDKDALAEIEISHNIDVEGEGRLSKVEQFVYSIPSSKNYFESKNSVQQRSILYEIKNVRESSKKFYYPNEYLADGWCYGPCTISQTYTKTAKAKYNFDVNIGSSTLKSAVGYDTDYSVTLSQYFSTTVADGQKINVKVYANYQSTEFDVYNKYTGNLVEKDCWIAKPVDLLVLRYTYAS